MTASTERPALALLAGDVRTCAARLEVFGLDRQPRLGYLKPRVRMARGFPSVTSARNFLHFGHPCVPESIGVWDHAEILPLPDLLN